MLQYLNLFVFCSLNDQIRSVQKLMQNLMRTESVCKFYNIDRLKRNWNDI